MYRDLIEAPEKIVVGGQEWWYQEFNGWDGNLIAVRLYDADGDFVCEFSDILELKNFLDGVVK